MQLETSKERVKFWELASSSAHLALEENKRKEQEARARCQSMEARCARTAEVEAELARLKD